MEQSTQRIINNQNNYGVLKVNLCNTHKQSKLKHANLWIVYIAKHDTMWYNIYTVQQIDFEEGMVYNEKVL